MTAAAAMIGARITAMHPLGSADDHAYILQDAGIQALCFDPSGHATRARALAERVPGLRLLALGPSDLADDLVADAVSRPPAPLVPRARADDIAGLTYTGGTSGRPKGVMSTHRVRVTMTMTELAEWDWPREPRFLAITPITHAAGAIVPPVLLRSGTVIVERGFDASRFAALVATHRATMTFVVPTMIYRLLDEPGLDAAALAGLEVVIYGAAPISPARLAEAVRRFGPVFMQLYGQTEAPNAITALRRADHDPDRHPERLASCGVPIGPSRVALLDEDGREVPRGEVGEICVRGPLVTAGYWNRPEETAHAYRHGWLHTGDMCRFDADGFLYLVGRKKELIKSGGENVYPREVEEALAAHPAVVDCSVFGVPHEYWGEAVKAAVVLRDGASASPRELAEWCRDRIAGYKRPRYVEIIAAIPRSEIGKVQKLELAARPVTPDQATD